MGTLVPEDFPLEQLADDAERSVVEAMRDGLSSNWHIVPDIGMRDEIDRQTDIVLVGILLYALLGKLADSAARLLERRFLSWSPAYQTKGARA